MTPLMLLALAILIAGSSIVRRSIVHRASRRVLGRGQYARQVNTVPVLSSTGTTNVTITFDQPVVISGTLLNTVATRTLVSQTVVSPTVVTQVWSGTVATLASNFPANDANCRTRLGGSNSGVSQTFP
jgi:hypothetical protein